MSNSITQLRIPPEIYEHAQQIASETNRTAEAVLLDALDLLFRELPETLLSPEEMHSFSDAQLRAVVCLRLAWTQDIRLNELIVQDKQRDLSGDEQTEMARLNERVDHQALLRSEALLLLRQRGHEVEYSPVVG